MQPSPDTDCAYGNDLAATTKIALTTTRFVLRDRSTSKPTLSKTRSSCTSSTTGAKALRYFKPPRRLRRPDLATTKQHDVRPRGVGVPKATQCPLMSRIRNPSPPPPAVPCRVCAMSPWQPRCSSSTSSYSRVRSTLLRSTHRKRTARKVGPRYCARQTPGCLQPPMPPPMPPPNATARAAAARLRLGCG